jgi:hypothetical protein
VPTLLPGVVVPPDLAGQVRDLVLLGAAARLRADGGGRLAPGVASLLAALDAAAHGRRPTGRFRPEHAFDEAETIEIGAVEFAERSGFSRQHVARLARRGALPARRAAGRWLIRVDADGDDDDGDGGGR